MAIVIQDAINEALNNLTKKGYKFDQSPMGKAMVEDIITATLEAVLKGVVTVPAVGLIAPQGPVTGQATGTIS